MPHPTPLPTHRNEPQSRRGRLRVLLAEDDLEMRRMVAAALRLDGHEVTEAETGRELSAYVQTVAAGSVVEPDLIISDVRMPGSTGLEVLHEVRALGLGIPVVLMTAFSDQFVHLEAFRLGAIGVLDKPFDLGDLRTLALILPRR